MCLRIVDGYKGAARDLGLHEKNISRVPQDKPGVRALFLISGPLSFISPWNPSPF